MNKHNRSILKIWRFDQGNWHLIPEPTWEVRSDGPLQYLTCQGFEGLNDFECGNHFFKITGWFAKDIADESCFVLFDFGNRLQTLICANFPSLLMLLKEISPILEEGWRCCDDWRRQEAEEERCVYRGKRI